MISIFKHFTVQTLYILHVSKETNGNVWNDAIIHDYNFNFRDILLLEAGFLCLLVAPKRKARFVLNYIEVKTKGMCIFVWINNLTESNAVRYSGVARALCWGGGRMPKAWESLRGTGACSPGKFWNLESLKCDFKHLLGDILENSEDCTVSISKTWFFTRYFFSELNELHGKVILENWERSPSHLISRPLHVRDVVARKSQCDFDRKFCILVPWDAIFRNLKIGLLFIRYRIHLRINIHAVVWSWHTLHAI
jgi:hypothetical protein